MEAMVVQPTAKRLQLPKSRLVDRKGTILEPR